MESQSWCFLVTKDQPDYICLNFCFHDVEPGWKDSVGWWLWAQLCQLDLSLDCANCKLRETNDLISLGLNFLICKMDVTIVCSRNLLLHNKLPPHNDLKLLQHLSWEPTIQAGFSRSSFFVFSSFGIRWSDQKLETSEDSLTPSQGVDADISYQLVVNQGSAGLPVASPCDLGCLTMWGLDPRMIIQGREQEEDVLLLMTAAKVTQHHLEGQST